MLNLKLMKKKNKKNFNIIVLVLNITKIIANKLIIIMKIILILIMNMMTEAVLNLMKKIIKINIIILNQIMT